MDSVGGDRQKVLSVKEELAKIVYGRQAKGAIEQRRPLNDSVGETGKRCYQSKKT